MSPVITSPVNHYVRLARMLAERRHRDRLGMFRLEGYRAVEAAAQAGVRIEVVLFTAEPPPWSLPGCSYRQVTPHVFQTISDTASPQGIMALGYQHTVSLAEAIGGDNPPFVLVVDGVQDPGNLGTILRTAAAAGVTAAVLVAGTVDVYNDKVLRAGAGEIFRLRIARDVPGPAIGAYLQARGIRVVVAAARAAIPYFDCDWRGSLAIVVGSEAAGPRGRWDGVPVSIPMYRPVESLNVAVATGILLFEAARQRFAIPISGRPSCH